MSTSRTSTEITGPAAPIGAAGATGEVPVAEPDLPIALAHPDSRVQVGGELRSREAREAELDRILAPGATRPVGAGVRLREEAPDPYRLCFERDLDRVKHSRPWRRLAGKCQVFIAPEDDHLRTRLTHAVEVAQIATGIARAAGLCVPLTEAIALAHDCGHGPAGHASEDAFSPYVPGGYDHAVYGADVTLAPLNLCVETLDGVRNHSWRRPAPMTPEGEVVAWADRIAYICHDFEDAVRAGILVPEDLPAEVAGVVGAANTDAWRLAQEQVEAERGRRDAQEERERRHQLELLALHPGRAFTRDEIIGRLWSGDAGVEAKVIDVYVSTVRRKTEDRLIETLRGTGYRLGRA